MSSAVVPAAAGCSVAAGLVHGVAAGTHVGDGTLAMTFAVTAVVQILAGLALFASPARRAALLVAAVNALCLGGWAASRVFTVPLLSANGPEAIGAADAVAAALAAGALAGAIVASTARVGSLTNARTHGLGYVLVAIPLVISLPSMTAAHEHAGGHGGDGHGHDAAASADHDHDDDATGADATLVDHAPWDDDLTDPHASHDHPFPAPPTAAQLVAASDLIARTTAATARFTDVAALEADGGWVTIEDGTQPGDFEHYFNVAAVLSKETLDPENVESLVYQWQPDGTKKLVSAMYMLADGDTMADVPDVAGNLTPWHDHNDLCSGSDGIVLVGIWDIDEQRCVPEGTLGPTPPMLHVWVTPNPCGPFAGIESHGGGDCTHGH